MTARVIIGIPAAGVGQVRCQSGEEIIDKVARSRSGDAIAENSLVTIDQVLGQVARNNKRLAADASDLQAKGLQERVGLSLPDPTVDFDWMGNCMPTASRSG